MALEPTDAVSEPDTESRSSEGLISSSGSSSASQPALVEQRLEGTVAGPSWHPTSTEIESPALIAQRMAPEETGAQPEAEGEGGDVSTSDTLGSEGAGSNLTDPDAVNALLPESSHPKRSVVGFGDVEDIRHQHPTE